MEKNKKITMSKCVLVQECMGESCIYNKTTEKIININKTGAEIIKMINGTTTFGELINYFSMYQCVSQKMIEEDIENFLNELLKKEIIELQI